MAAGTSRTSLITVAVIVVAAGAVLWTYRDFMANPWTRHGQVMAQVVQVTPRVSGTIVDLQVEDNQFVKAGDLLFQIDPRTYQSTVDGMAANLDGTIDEIEALTRQVEASQAQVRRYEAAVARAEQQVAGKTARLTDYQLQLQRYARLIKTGAASRERLDRAEADVADTEAVVTGAKAELLEAQAALIQAKADLAKDRANLGAAGDANARLRRAKAKLHSAELNLEFTTVVAPVDGYVTNLRMRLGDHATANKALLALVDVNSYWISAFFNEGDMDDVEEGNRAIITLMGYPNQPLEGRVDSVGWGVWQSDGSTAQLLLPKISATFAWIRLAQRMPVRIHLTKVPDDVELRVGATGTVVVKAGTNVPPPEEPASRKPAHATSQEHN